MGTCTCNKKVAGEDASMCEWISRGLHLHELCLLVEGIFELREVVEL